MLPVFETLQSFYNFIQVVVNQDASAVLTNNDLLALVNFGLALRRNDIETSAAQESRNTGTTARPLR